MNRKPGFTLVELLVVIAIIALLISLLLPALSKAIRNGRSLKDGTQVKEIHQSMVTYATNNKGKYPIPGQINRDDTPPVPGLPPNTGSEDFGKNHTRHFYSCMIAQEFFPTKLLIGPTEINPRIFDAENYNFSAYNPGQDIYWDGDGNPPAPIPTTFQCFIFAPPGGPAFCNTSYAHMTICGNRKKEKFRDTAGGGDPVIGTRGVVGSNNDQATTIISESSIDYRNAQSLLLHDPKKSWDGNVAFGDNHTERLNSMYYTNTTYEFGQDALAKDNIYYAEFGAQPGALAHHKEGDAFLSISNSATADGLAVTVRQEDLLD